MPKNFNASYLVASSPTTWQWISLNNRPFTHNVATRTCEISIYVFQQQFDWAAKKPQIENILFDYEHELLIASFVS